MVALRARVAASNAAASSSSGGGTLFCFGTGYTALALASALRARGWAVHGTSRSRTKETALRECGVIPHLFDPSRGQDLGDDAIRALRSSSAVLSTVPPCEARGAHGLVDPVATLLRGLGQTSSRWVGYVSTTSVYGDDWGGDWVTEETPLGGRGPVAERAALRIRAEREWLSLAGALPIHVFRSGGIYGPLRNVLESRATEENARRRRAQRFVSRCHVFDLAAVLSRSIEAPGGGIYNVVDDCPAPRDVVERFVRGEPGGWAGGSPGSGGKRVSNAKIKAELGVRLEFPTYAEGMTAIMRGDARPFTPEALRALGGEVA